METVDIRRLKAKWKPLLEEKSLGTIKEDRKGTIAMLLENQEKFGSLQQNMYESFGQGFQNLQEAAPANASGAFPSATNLKGYDPVMISMIRRAMPKLIAFDVLGVQPMSGPTGLVFALKSKYTSQGGTEALFNEADTTFSGTGTQTGTNPVPQALSTDYTSGTGMSTSAGEALGDGVGPDFAQMAFSIDKVTVTAKTRALKGELTAEIQQDLKAVHGLDAEAEIVNMLSNELLFEINREIIRTIYHTAKTGAQNNVTTAGTFDMDVDSDGRWSVEKFKGLMFQIQRDANAIAKETRRGKGNVLLTNSDVASALTMAKMLDVGGLDKSAESVDDTADTYVGTLNGIKVFIDPYTPFTDSNWYVVGYKGSSAYDSGLFYCPYVGLEMVKAINPANFYPKIGFRTRYGIVANPFATSAGDGVVGFNHNIYYRRVSVANLT